MIEILIVDDGQTSLDLTCGWPIDAELVDERDRKLAAFEAAAEAHTHT